MRLKDKVIIVTGGANGIGRRYSERMIQEGAKVVVADLDLNSAQELVGRFNEEEKRAVAVQVDVSSESDTQRMVDTALEHFGRIDVLVNNAGIYPHVEWDDITYEHWRKVMTINLDSVFLTCKATTPHMKKQRSGKIINVATDLVWVGLSGMVHYIASKGGVVAFTRSLAREMGEFNITVNGLAPGPVIPDITNMNISETSRTRLNMIVNAQALRRRLEADDLVGPMIFLCSSDADFITSQILTVDGGLTNH